MQTMQLHSKVGSDGVLSLNVALGTADADSEVVVTIEPLPSSRRAERLRNWREIVDQTYGSCAGLDLERPDQGAFEVREELE
jgi:hypothetical protein